MSTDFYARLEQRRGSRPSEQTVGAIARALRLTQDERDHLFQLAGHVAPPRGFRTDHVTPALLRVLDRLDTPAQVVSDLGVVLVQNPLAEALLGEQTHFTGLERSVVYRWFTDPAERERWPEEDHADPLAQLRRLAARGTRARSRPRRSRSSTRCCSAARSSRRCGSGTRSATRAEHPQAHPAPAVGLIELDCQILTSENQIERLVVFTATPGTEDAERLAMLAVIGTQTFDTSVGSAS